MSKLFKNSATLVIVISLLLQLFPIQVKAAGDTSEMSFEANGGLVYYTVDEENNTITIVGCEESVTAVDIPETIDGKPVTAIGTSAFLLQPLTSVTLPASLTKIGQRAFYETDITSLVIPASVRRIEDRAFKDCESLEELTILPGTQYIGFEAFYGCKALVDTTIDVPASVTEVKGGAFAGISSYHYTYNSTTGEATFTDPKYLNIVFRNPDVSFTFDKSSGIPIGYIDYPIYAQDDTDEENPMWDPIYTPVAHIYGYAENSAGLTSDVKKLADWTANIQVPPPASQPGGTLMSDITFHELGEAAPEEYTVSGTLLQEGAEVEIRRGNTSVNVTMNSQAFSATVQDGADVVVIVSLDGYYDRVYVKPMADFNGDWNLGSVTAGEPLPSTGRVYVSITRADTGVDLGSFEGLTLALKNGDIPLTPDTDYTVQYPYIIINNPDTVTSLTLIVTPDDSMRLGGGMVTSPMSEGRLSLALEPWGKLYVTTTGSFAGDNNVLIFDADTNALVESGTTSAGVYISDSLPEGDYRIVAFNRNPVFSSAASPSALTALGLTAGDYTTSVFTVDNGETKTASLTVPVLDTASLTSFLDTGHSCVTVEETRAVVGQTVNVRVFYTLVDDLAEGNKKIIFTIPSGLELESVCSATEQLGTITEYTTVEPNGVFYLRLKVNNSGVYTVGAAIEYNGTTVPIGSAPFTARPIYLELADKWLENRINNSVDVLAAPNTPVSLYVGDNTTPVTATTKLNGRATISYNLPVDAVFGDVFTLRAVVAGGEAIDSVTFLPDVTTLKKLSFIHAGTKTVVIDVDNTSLQRGYYTYVANGVDANNYWSFYAELEGDTAVTGAMLFVEMMDGSVRTTPMTIIGTENTGAGVLSKCSAELYIVPAGDHVFDNSRIPCGFWVDWDRKPREFTPDFNRINAQAEARIQTRNDAVAAAAAVAHAGIPYAETADAALKRLFDYDHASNQDVLDILIAELINNGWTAEVPDEAVTLFGYGYKVSDEAGFSLMQADFRAKVYEIENLLDKICDIYTGLLKLPRPIQEYSSWDDVYEAIGLVYTQGGGINDGESFTPIGDAKHSRLREGGGFSLVDTSANYRLDVTGRGVNLMASSGDQSTSWSNIQHDSTTASAGMTALSIALDAKTTELAEIVASNAELIGDDIITNPLLKDEIVDEMFSASEYAKRLEASKISANTAGNALTAVQIYSDGDAYCENIVTLAEMEGELDHLDILDNRYSHTEDSSDCLTAIRNEKAKLEELLTLLNDKSTHLICNMSVGTISILASPWSGGVSAVAGAGYDYVSSGATNMRDYAIAEIRQEYEQLKTQREIECDEANARLRRRLTPKLDPSGIVYEALESNPLSGVSAMIYKASDAAGTGAAAWSEAADYDEVNPQTTAADGAYAWDVPAGWWQVRFTKAGYNNANTDWMQVPPPRMNLATPMVSASAPAVLSANAYSDYIELIFSQYMDTSAVLAISDGMTGVWQGIENSLSKVLHIVKDGFFEGTVSFTLNGAKNYAGTALGAYNSGNLTVSTRPAEILLNYETTIPMKAGESHNVTVRVKDSDGNYMQGVTIDAVISNTLLATISSGAVTDVDGKAVFSAEALLPGLTDITFTVHGTSLCKTAALRITLDVQRPARPTAVIGTVNLTAASPKENYVTVTPGTLLTLNAEPGAAIFYTTDDTCPCQNSTSRRLYTGPITLNTNAKYRIAAYVDGKAYSERLNITVTMSSGGSATDPTPAPAPSPAHSPAPDSLPPETVTAPVNAEETMQWDNPFSDIKETDWFYDAVVFVYKNGMMTGTTDNTFNPQSNTSRGMIVTILWRLEGEPVAEKPFTFTDVGDGKWYYKAVAWAAENGIVDGYSADKFGPEDNITREQMAKILCSYAAYKSYDVSARGDLSAFTDSPSGWALEYVQWAVAEGLIQGKGNAILDPLGKTKRSECAAILQRFIEKHTQ